MPLQLLAGPLEDGVPRSNLPVAAAQEASAEPLTAASQRLVLAELQLLQHLAEVVGRRMGLTSLLSFVDLPKDLGATPVAPQPSTSNAPRYAGAQHPVASVAVWAVLAFAAGFFYKTHRATPTLELEKARTAFKEQDFVHGPFDCFGDMEVCCWSFWCGAVRWSDSMNAVGVLTFWLALSFLVVAESLSAIPGLLFIWALGAMVCTYFRQELRRALDMENENLCCDLFMWCCCPCCAIAQEARQVKEARKLEQAV